MSGRPWSARGVESSSRGIARVCARGRLVGWVGGFALLLGAAAGLTLATSQRVIGLIMAFGAGVVISALAFELADEAFRRGGTDAVAVGLAVEALAFFVG